MATEDGHSLVGQRALVTSTVISLSGVHSGPEICGTQL